MITNKRHAELSEKNKIVESTMETRFKWFHFLVDEAVRGGLDIEFVREAIRRCGVWHHETKYPAECDLYKIDKVFANDAASKVFEMEQVELSDDVMHYRFHYCPAIHAWQDVGVDDDTIARYCDLCMEGDRGICSGYPELEMVLSKTIASGDDCCDIVFRKKK